ncbi:MAG: oligosaccharide flippase family protein [Candidatus Levybacteria bacterium]|nr:oligosaccharide flippase family protein [Candidatus Levybacteria bacterium]
MNITGKDGLFKRKVAHGVFILSVRRVLYQLILTSSNILLARILVPEIFGAFMIVSFLILNLGILTNGGLAQALIQKKEPVSKEDVQTVLTTVILTSMIFIICIYIAAPFFHFVYQGKLGTNEIYWLRIYSIYILFANIYALLMALVERKLEYSKITFIELITLSVTQGITIVFALFGWGIGSFAIGSLSGIGIGICLLYIFNPLPVGIFFSRKILRQLSRFGFHYQQGAFLSAINSAVIPGYVGIVSGPRAVGYVTVMGGIRQVGLAPTDIISRLLFASSSYLQKNKKLLRSLVEKTIRLSSMTSLPLLGILFALAPALISLALSPQWLPALLTLYLSIIQGIFLILSSIFMQVLLGLGHAKFVRNTTLIWTAVQWILTPVFILIWDYNGVVIAGIVVSLLYFIPLRKLKEDIDVQVFPYFMPYLIYSLLTAGMTYVIAQVIIVDSIFRLVEVGFLGMLFYLAILIIIERRSLMLDIRLLIKLLIQKK